MSKFTRGYSGNRRIGQRQVAPSPNRRPQLFSRDQQLQRRIKFIQENQRVKMNNRYFFGL
jgi:hypothetical protein